MRFQDPRKKEDCKNFQKKYRQCIKDNESE